jgi:hypothetical protein
MFGVPFGTLSVKNNVARLAIQVTC